MATIPNVLFEKEKVKKNDSFYFKGEVTVGSDVFNYEEWSEKPTQSRKKYSNRKE